MHITQRGVDRCSTFHGPDDYRFYKHALLDTSRRVGCPVHAYALMTNHVHLLVTPSELSAPARLMRSLGGRYTQFFNVRYGRTGGLWEGRYRSTVVDTAPYFFACSRYIELNPTRAGIVADPEAYEWSSFRHNALGRDDPVVTSHGQYLTLATEKEARERAYSALFAVDLDADIVATIRTKVRRDRPNGTVLTRRPRHRPVSAIALPI
jgi:putative transposase